MTVGDEMGKKENLKRYTESRKQKTQHFQPSFHLREAFPPSVFSGTKPNQPTSWQLGVATTDRRCC